MESSILAPTADSRGGGGGWSRQVCITSSTHPAALISYGFVPHLDLFHALVKTAPLTILSNLGKLSNTLDYLSMFQIQTSEGILNALTPLMKINVNLKDSLMLILRKAMFGR